MSVLPVAHHRRELRPVGSRGSWIAWGLGLQVVGVGIPAVTALRRAHEAGVGGAVTHATAGDADWSGLADFVPDGWPGRRRRK